MNSNSNIDLIVLTYNEEINLDFCLQSAQFLIKNIFIVDSGSSDKTCEIAEQYGAHVVNHPFVNQAQQFNWALDNLPIESPWILRLDADEFLTPELILEIKNTLMAAPEEITGFYIRRRMIFMNKWIRFGGYYPVWLLRLFRYGQARSEKVEMDEHIVLLRGTSQQLKSDFIHEDHKGLFDWTMKHTGYAFRQSRLLTAWQKGTQKDEIHPRLFGNHVERRRWLKRYVFNSIPLFIRPFLNFVFRYFFLLGFLDGLPGLIYHFLHGFWFPFYVDSLIYEKKLAGNP